MPSPPSGSPAWYGRPEPWVFLTALGARLLVLSRLVETPYFLLQKGDMYFYHTWAERVVAGNWTDHHAFYGLPGYAFLLAGIYRLAGQSSFARFGLVSILQILIEACVALIIFTIARKVCSSEKNPRRALPIVAGVAASLAWMTFIPAQTFSTILMPTAWVVCAYWLGVSRLMRDEETTVWRPWLWYGLGIGAFSMLVATITFLLPLVFARLVRSVARSRPWRERAPRMAAAAGVVVVGLFAGCAPAWIHNYFIAHDPVLLSAHGGLNFWMGNNPDATGYPKVPPGLRTDQDGLLRDSIIWAEKAAGHPLQRSEVSRYWSAQAHRYIAEHPAEWLALLGRKLRNFWNAFQYDDLSVITLLDDRGVLLPGLRWGLVAALGLAGLLVAVRRNAPARWVAAAVLLHMLAIMPVFITERYRLAAAPGLIVLGVCGLARLWTALVEREWVFAGGVAALATGAAFFVSWPVHDPALWALDPYNVGVKELDVAETLPALPGTAEERERNRAEAAVELRRADAHLRQAYAFVQGDPGVTFALGNLFLEEGDPAQARDFYRRALALNPRYTGALNNLGYLAMRDKEWPAAERFFAAAIESEPENAKSYYLLAQAREGAGDLAGAREAIARAVEMKPGQREFVEVAQRLRDKAPAPSP